MVVALEKAPSAGLTAAAPNEARLAVLPPPFPAGPWTMGRQNRSLSAEDKGSLANLASVEFSIRERASRELGAKPQNLQTYLHTLSAEPLSREQATRLIDVVSTVLENQCGGNGDIAKRLLRTNERLAEIVFDEKASPHAKEGRLRELSEARLRLGNVQGQYHWFGTLLRARGVSLEPPTEADLAEIKQLPVLLRTEPHVLSFAKSQETGSTVRDDLLGYLSTKFQDPDQVASTQNLLLGFRAAICAPEYEKDRQEASKKAAVIAKDLPATLRDRFIRHEAEQCCYRLVLGLDVLEGLSAAQSRVGLNEVEKAVLGDYPASLSKGAEALYEQALVAAASSEARKLYGDMTARTFGVLPENYRKLNELAMQYVEKLDRRSAEQYVDIMRDVDILAEHNFGNRPRRVAAVLLPDLVKAAVEEAHDSKRLSDSDFARLVENK